MTLNGLVEKVYLINLPSSIERLEKVSAELNRNNIKFEIIEPEIVEHFSGENESIGWNKNAKSLQETTKKIVKQAKEKGYKNIFIFEDDAVIIDDNFSRFVSDFATFKNKYQYDFLFLNYTGYKFSIQTFDNFRLSISGVFRCQAYVINESVYDLYLKRMESCEEPIDHSTKFLQIKRKRSLVYEPNPVIQKQGLWSTIREKLVDY